MYALLTYDTDAPVLDDEGGRRVVVVEAACHDALVHEHEQCGPPDPRLLAALVLRCAEVDEVQQTRLVPGQALLAQ
jgi:hypothetical protein